MVMTQQLLTPKGSLAPHRWQVWMTYDPADGMWTAHCPNITSIDPVRYGFEDDADTWIKHRVGEWFIKHYNDHQAIMMIPDGDLPEPPEGTKVSKWKTS